jgi:hypothetical protein
VGDRQERNVELPDGSLHGRFYENFLLRKKSKVFKSSCNPEKIARITPGCEHQESGIAYEKKTWSRWVSGGL